LKRFGWFVLIYSVSVALLGLLAFAVRSLLR
jgi:hypothetical protein